MAQNLKLKVLTLITKLSDRDTYNVAAAEMESIAVSLDNSTLSIYLSCILSTDSTDKSLVRKQCLQLLSTLSRLYSNSLSTFLPKILSYLCRRLRDPDSSIRSQCVSTISSLASNVTKSPFFTAFLKPLSEAVFTEQDLNAQIGSALCLAAAIDAAPDPDPARLGRALLPKMEKLLKSDAYKAKGAGLIVIASIIGAGGVAGYGGMSGLVNSLVGFLSNDDWAARKAAAEALGKLAVAERDAMAEFKSGCLRIFESRRFDKVKATREVMNQMIEAWKQVPDLSDEASPPPRSLASSREGASDGRCPTGSKISAIATSETPQMRKKPVLSTKTIPPDCSSANTTRKRGSLKSAEKKTSPGMFRKMNCNNPSDWKVEITGPLGSSLSGINENVVERRARKSETKRALFSKNSDDKMLKCSGFRSGSRVAPYQEESIKSTVVLGNGNENHHSNHKECEDLSLIRNQLIQIEKQQSSLMDLLQKFIGSSQKGMQSLETRVHGLELALDGISYDLGVSSGRMTDSHRIKCCLLPGMDFLSSRFRRKAERHYPTSRLAALHRESNINENAESFNLGSRRLRLQGGGAFIVNPLAEIHGITEVAQR